MLMLALQKLGLKRLEPCDGKLSCTVLRGWKKGRPFFHYPTLILVIIGFSSSAACADVSDARWAEELASRTQEQVMEDMKNMMDLPGFDPSAREEALRPRPALQVFVSSAMPKELLKKYAVEAKRYGGVLVFRGLPSGSVLKLTDLVISISSSDSAPMQIDDEAFAAFDVNSVPTIVLSKSTSLFSDQQSTENFDKVTGNITIKAALELFANSGEMQPAARERLK